MSISSLVQKLQSYIGQLPSDEFYQIVRQITDQGVCLFPILFQSDKWHDSSLSNALFVTLNSKDSTIARITCNEKDKPFTREEYDTITRLLSLDEDSASIRIANNPNEFSLLQRFREATDKQLRRYT